MIDMTELHKEQKVDEVKPFLWQIIVLIWLELVYSLYNILCVFNC